MKLKTTEQERHYFGKFRRAQLATILWSFVVTVLASLGWLVFQYPAQVGKSLSDAASAVTEPVAPLIHRLPIVPFGTLSRPTTVLFLGTDVVYHDASRRQADSQSCRGNSDTMMLLFLNPAHNTVSVLHIPRDTEAYVGKCGIRKINSANVIGGPSLAKDTVSALLDVPIDHYVVMNIHGLVELVDELGGITITVPKRMNYMDWTGKLKIDLQPGNHTLTGNQAMGFVRFRHDALGDIGRIQRQQIFLQAAIKKMLDPASWLHLNALVEIAQRNIRTEMSNVDIFETLNFIHSVSRENVKFVMLPGQFAANGDWLANTDGKAIAQRLAGPDQETVRSRRNINVCIVNASSNRSLGNQLAKTLRTLGYITCVGRDEDEPASNRTRIIAQDGNIADAKMMMQDLGNIGEVVNASVGNLATSITIVAHDDIKLDQIRLSSADAPYFEPPARAQPLVVKPSLASALGTKRGKQSCLHSGADAAEIRLDDKQKPNAAAGETSSKTNGELSGNQPKDSTASPASDAVEVKGTSEPSEEPPSVLPPAGPLPVKHEEQLPE